MSLISDALKKARQEAARQDSLRQGLPYAVGSTEAPRSRSSAPLLAGLAVGLLLAAGLAGLFYLMKPEPETRIAETSPPAEVREEPVAAVPSAPPVAPQISEPAVPEAAPPAPIPAPVPEVRTPEPVPPPQVQPAPQPQPQPETPPAPPVVAAPPAPPVQEAAPSAPAPAPAPQESRSYVGEVPVPGGGVLRLNGIAFSTESPVAVLDGKVVGPGEVVQGFTVVEIRQNQVKLEGHGETVFVSLK